MLVLKLEPSSVQRLKDLFLFGEYVLMLVSVVHNQVMVQGANLWLFLPTSQLHWVLKLLFGSLFLLLEYPINLKRLYLQQSAGVWAEAYSSKVWANLQGRNWQRALPTRS